MNAPGFQKTRLSFMFLIDNPGVKVKHHKYIQPRPARHYEPIPPNLNTVYILHTQTNVYTVKYT